MGKSVEELKDEDAKQVIAPGEPRAGVHIRVVFVERFVHEESVRSGGFQNVKEGGYFGFVVGSERLHDNAHVPNLAVLTGVWAPDALTKGASKKVRIGEGREKSLASAQVKWIESIDVAEIGQRKQGRDVGIIHERATAKSIGFIEKDGLRRESGVFNDAIELNGLIDLICQSRKLLGKRGVFENVVQQQRGSPQADDSKTVCRNEILEKCGVVRGTKRRLDQTIKARGAADLMEKCVRGNIGLARKRIIQWIENTFIGRALLLIAKHIVNLFYRAQPIRIQNVDILRLLVEPSRIIHKTTQRIQLVLAFKYRRRHRRMPHI